MNMNRGLLPILLLFTGALTFGCGGAPKPKVDKKPVVKGPPQDARAPGIPSPAIDAFEVGVKSMQAKPPKYTEAVDAFKKATSIHGDYVIAWLNLALSYEKLGRYEDAARTYRTLIEKRVIDRGVTLALGRALLLSKETDAAITEFRSVLSKNAQDLQAQNNLAAAYLKKGDLDTSLSYVKDVLAVQPKNVPAIVNLGLIYLKKNKLPLARLMFKKALSYDKKNARAQNNLGLTYYQMAIKDRAADTLPQAVLAFEKAIALDPTMDEARLNVASVFLDYLDYARALVQFQAVRKRFPKHYVAMIGEADSLYGVGKYEDAIRIYLESLKIRSQNPEALLRTGKIYEQQLNKPKDALAFYKKYVAAAKPAKTAKIHQTIMLLEQAGKMKMQTMGGGDMAPEGGEKTTAGAPEGGATPAAAGDTKPPAGAPEGGATPAADGDTKPPAGDTKEKGKKKDDAKKSDEKGKVESDAKAKPGTDVKATPAKSDGKADEGSKADDS
jgi:tetratricopeptide (TPR) repeat protein